jgi:hypothetical protein
VGVFVNHGKVNPQIARGLKEIDKRIGASIPPSQLDETLNLCTWNVRELGKKPRTEAAIHYLAEILGRFDVVSLLELRDNLEDLKHIMDILGPYWRVVYSDYVADSKGNDERVAFLYDKRACTFTGLAAEPDPPRVEDPVTHEVRPAVAWWRSPYMASFRAGDFDFVVLSAHVRWGKTVAGRKMEVEMLGDWVAKRVEEKHVEDQDFILTGDFNIASVNDDIYKKLQGKGLVMPQATMRVPATNLKRDAHYDQILHFPKYTKNVFTDHGGILDFAAGGWEALFPKTEPEYARFTGDAYTFQLSDHFPLWVQINTDVDGERLDQLLGGKPRRVTAQPAVVHN